MREYRPPDLKAVLGLTGTTKPHQDFGEIAPLLLCGPLHQEQTFPKIDPPAPKIKLLKEIRLFNVLFSFPNALKSIFYP